MLWKKLCFALLVASVSSENAFPSDITKCKLNESDCYVKIMNDIFANKFSGYPGLNLPSLDPLKITKMQIKQGGDSPINIVLDFNNIIISGIAKTVAYKATGFSKTITGDKVVLRMKSPSLSVHGPYKINGKVLILPIQGDGQSNLTIGEPDVAIKFISKKVETAGKTYMQVDKLKVYFETSRLYMDFSNLFNGDKALGDNMNLFLNDNWSDILKELKPAITEAFAKVFMDVINGVFVHIPYDQLFAD